MSARIVSSNSLATTQPCRLIDGDSATQVAGDRLPGSLPARGARRALAGLSSPVLAAFLIAALGSITTLGGCGEPEAVVGDEKDLGVTTDVDATLAETTDDDVPAVDTGSDTGGQGDTGGDALVTLDCTGSIKPAGCPCTSNAQCTSTACIETPNGQQCTSTCTETCAANFKCVAGEGGDSISICVPKHGKLCNPCSANAECTATGNKDARCVDQGNNGSFCGSSCAVDTDCPSTHACLGVKDVAGQESKQCVVKDGGACGCSLAAKNTQLSTKCYSVSGDSKCEGKRTCLPATAPGAPPEGGLTACVAAKPAEEICDGTDNDCDSKTDEGTCDDAKVCTDDKCNGAAGCSNKNNTLACDADESTCTEDDACAEGKCVAGKKKTCDDNNPCTKDTCDPKAGCKFEIEDGALCNADDNECTVSDICKAGKCAPGELKACSSPDGCTTGKCKLDNGKCEYAFQDGNPCNDGNPCTQGETCKVDACKGAVVDCDDKNACTADSCDPKTGCLHAAVKGVCDDGDKCTSGDDCLNGVCKGLAIDVTATCDDAVSCTSDSCDKLKGCVNKATTGATCDDGNACTINDACKDGKCASDDNKCTCTTDADCLKEEDGNPCNGTLYCDKSVSGKFTCTVKLSTIKKCDDSQNNACQKNDCDASTKTGDCKFTKKSDGVLCDADQSLCTNNDACKDGQCAAGATQICDDKQPCTDDSCDPAKGCKFTPNTNPCNADDNPCTENDVCTLGTCVAGKSKSCTTDDTCVDGKCSLLTGKCGYSFKEGTPCNDGSPCTLNDLCKVDKCSGAAANCDDNNACTGDSCDPKSGCVHSNVSAVCSDNDACTSGDACKDGACKGSAIDVKVACEDDEPCTIDACDPKSGCTHKSASGPCDDKSPCTSGEECLLGKCAGGTQTCGCSNDSDCKDDTNLCNGTVFCDKAKLPYKCGTNQATIVTCNADLDGPCQTNVCDPKTGKCGFDKKPDALSCDADNNLCTAGDACLDGKCIVGKVQVCDDKNACTDDSCDPKLGCKYAQTTAPCDADNNACTQNDVCDAGSCVTGKLKVCDDKEGCTQDVCDTKTAACKYVPIVKSCTDDNQCTTGDTCADNIKTGNYTCVGGKAANCNDQNPCTVDTCDPLKGCANTIDTTIVVACYSGDPATKGKGQCKEGGQQCGIDGKLGVCKNEVLPGPKELCDGVDNTCDGVLDEGCAPTGFTARMATVVVSGGGSQTKFTTRAMVGGSNGAGPAGGTGKITAHLGFYQYVKKFFGL